MGGVMKVRCPRCGYEYGVISDGEVDLCPMCGEFFIKGDNVKQYYDDETWRLVMFVVVMGFIYLSLSRI